MTITDDKIMDMFNNIDNKLDIIHIQTTKTNGKVMVLEEKTTKIEKRSIGVMVHNNPWKALLYMLLIVLLISCLINDSANTVKYIVSVIF